MDAPRCIFLFVFLNKEHVRRLAEQRGQTPDECLSINFGLNRQKGDPSEESIFRSMIFVWRKILYEDAKFIKEGKLYSDICICVMATWGGTYPPVP